MGRVSGSFTGTPPRDALVWDRAGEVVARRAMAVLSDGDGGVGAPAEIVLYKNNVDGKGAAYGAHENYLVRRDVPFEELRDFFFIPGFQSRWARVRNCFLLATCLLFRRP